MITETAHRFLSAFWELTLEMSPWLLIGFFAAGLVKYLLKDAWIQKHLGKRGVKGAVSATLWGIPIPLCSCGVLPVAVAFRKKGASPESTLAFITSTPQTGVDSIFATIGILGLPIAMIRVASAFVSGVITGTIAGLFTQETKPNGNGQKKDQVEPGSCCGDSPADSQSDCCSGPESADEARPGFWNSMVYGFRTIPAEINTALVVGLLIGAVLGLLGEIPALRENLSNPWVAYLISGLLAIPLYTCSTGSIPMAAGLVAAGASPGAAIVFLILGPATNVITVTSIHSMMGRKTTVIYLVLVSLIGLITGILADMAGIQVPNNPAVPGHDDSHGWWKLISAIIFISVMVLTFIPASFRGKKSSESSCCSGSDNDESDGCR